jgi:Family of unknown function (DUF6505)
MKLLRTIRLGASDSFVFDKPAEPGEWVVSGAFAFACGDPAKLQGSARSAFRARFWGLASLGRSTLVQTVEARESDREVAVGILAARLLAHFGAPDGRAARLAAEEEIDFAASRCIHPPGAVIAVTRCHEQGAIRETFRTVRPREGAEHARAFEFLEVVGEDAGPSEYLDLLALRKGEAT